MMIHNISNNNKKNKLDDYNNMSIIISCAPAGVFCAELNVVAAHGLQVLAGSHSILNHLEAATAAAAAGTGLK
jgi:hypothetical protein